MTVEAELPSVAELGESAEVRGWRRYPAYKDSGVPWLGEVPAHWDVKRLRFLAEVRTGVTKGRDLGEKDTVSVPYMRVANVQDGYLDLSDVAQVEVLPDEVRRFSLRPGDVLMNEGGDNDKLGRGTVWEGQIDPCLHQNHVFAVRLDDADDARWISAATSATYARHYFMVRAKQSTNLASISGTNVKEFPVVLPPKAERRAILRHLAHETARIDALVEKKRRLLGLIEEKRAALISHAVTRGLDASVPMKDSGVEWLGQVPAHWEVKRLRFLVPEVTVGIVVTPARYYVDEGVPALRSLNVRDGRLRDSDLVYMSPESNEIHRKSRLSVGDLVCVRSGQPGATAVVDERFDGANCIDLIIVRQSKRIVSEFLAYVANSSMAKVQFEHGSDGALQQHFNVETAKSLLVTVPPVAEQKAIVEYVAHETTRLDELAGRVRRHVELLGEYRTALISAAVTGKIDVREATR
ncbi:MAG: restriction endonuclease subunit S [Chloroflexota bacterium]